MATIDRRTFVKVMGVGGAALLVGVRIGDADHLEAGGSRAEFEPNAWVRLDANGVVEITAPVPEIGQGVRTALPMIVASELAVDFASVRVRQAESGAGRGSMNAAGSNSVADYFTPLRRAGATARMMLVSAAAQQWSVDAASCSAVDGTVRGPDGRAAPYTSLLEAAARQPVPAEPRLLSPDEQRILGRATASVDLADIVTGRAVYGLDARVPGMRFAVIARSPSAQGRLRAASDAAALAVPGVERIERLDRWISTHPFKGYGELLPGVAVIARNTWAAIQGRTALDAAWDGAVDPSADSGALRRTFMAAADGAGTVMRDDGDVEAAFAGAARRIDATYELPLLPHACMEPMNFTADVREDSCVATGPVQNVLLMRAILGELLGMPEERVVVRPTLVGGGFGRRLSVDYGVEAAVLSRRIGAPVQVVWTREDDMRHDHFRPPAVHKMSAALDTAGRVLGWDHHLVCAGLQRHLQGPPEADRPALYDIQGAAEMPLSVPAFRFRYSAATVPMRLGSWRSVAHSHNVFAVASLIDEIAAAAGRDPLDVNLELLSPGRAYAIALPLPGSRGRVTGDTALIRRVLERAAREAAWGSALPPGRGRGIAWCVYKQSYAAHVAEVTVQAGGEVRVDRIVTAVDCGRVVNPDGVAAQCEGGAMDAVGATLHWESAFEGGAVIPLNFDRHRMPRIADAPAIEVHVLDSDRAPSGAGEVTHPAVIPAITNAIYAASGERIRRLPVRGR